MNDLINMETCRKLREVIHVLTETPVITKKEFLELAFLLATIMERIEKEQQDEVIP